MGLSCWFYMYCIFSRLPSKVDRQISNLTVEQLLFKKNFRQVLFANIWKSFLCMPLSNSGISPTNLDMLCWIWWLSNTCTLLGVLHRYILVICNFRSFTRVSHELILLPFFSPCCKSMNKLEGPHNLENWVWSRLWYTDQAPLLSCSPLTFVVTCNH